MKQLTPFDGKDVLSTKVAVTNAGDGLSASLAVDPQELHHGQRGVLVMEYEVAKIRFDQVADTDCLDRVHILKAGTTVIADEATIKQVKGLLDDQADRILRAKEAGQMRLSDGAAVEHAALLKAHGEGDHTKLVAGCPGCDAEDAASDAEAGATPIAGRKRRTRK